jgi:hypothetical protein
MRFVKQSVLAGFFCLVSLNTTLAHGLHRSSLRLHYGEGLSVQLFSSCTDIPFARLAMQRVSPARVNLLGSELGMGIPGYRIVGLQISLFPVPCSAADWEQLLEALRPLKSANAALRGGVRLRLPNGQSLFGPNPPEVRGETLIVEATHPRRTQSGSYMIQRDGNGAPCVFPLSSPATDTFPSHEHKTNK